MMHVRTAVCQKVPPVGLKQHLEVKKMKPVVLAAIELYLSEGISKSVSQSAENSTK